ncbi:MAG: uncharacterized protein JWO48_930 [Bryobacterales bacterium]|nr:uncharacterized protein [Bryobacterales bacterium]
MKCSRAPVTYFFLQWFAVPPDKRNRFGEFNRFRGRNMSGSSGGGGDTWRPDPRSGKQRASEGEIGTDDPCAIAETTTLNSVDRSVLANVRIGDVLDVRYLSGPPRRLVAQARDAVVGSITSPSMPQIIQCIAARGQVYEAEVRSIRGAMCQVEVRRR